MFIIFTVRHHTHSQEPKFQLIWFVTGVRKYYWHATTRRCQQIVLLTKRLLEAFRWQISQEPNVNLCYIWQSVAKYIE